MPIPRRRLLTALASGAALFALGSAGCEVKSPYMMVLDPKQAFGPSKDMATVVFLRPDNNEAGQLVTIVDEHHGFVGDSLAQTYFAVKLPPGGRNFYTLSRDAGTDALRTDLAAGRVYFVYISLGTDRSGAGQAANLSALTPRAREWPLLSTWLAKSKQLAVAPASGTLEGTSRYPDIDARINNATAAMRVASPAELELRTIRPEDGM